MAAENVRLSASGVTCVYCDVNGGNYIQNGFPDHAVESVIGFSMFLRWGCGVRGWVEGGGTGMIVHDVILL